MEDVRTAIVSVLSFAVLAAGCSGVTAHNQTNGFAKSIIGQPDKLDETPSTKLWEGEIGGKAVAYYRSKENGGFSDIIIVTEDALPKAYRSIRYCDRDSDRNVDLIDITIYRQGTGWNDVRIGGESVTTLKQANPTFHQLMDGIQKDRARQIDF